MDIRENAVSDAVSVFTYGGEELATSYGVNAVAFFGAGATVLVDPFVSPVHAAALGALLGARGEAPVTHVVLTHHHTDHALGASWFASKGAEVIAHEGAAAAMAAEHPALVAERRRLPAIAPLFDSAEPYVPSRIVPDGFLLETAGLRLDIFHPGHGHTPGDLCVYAPKLGVVVTGDLVSRGYHPNLEDADMKGWLAALERLRTLPFWTLVPGHGPIGGREALEDQLHYFERAREIVAAAPKTSGEDAAADAVARAFPDFRLAIVLPALVNRLRPR